MGFRISTNVVALGSHRVLAENYRAEKTAMQKLGSGTEIQSAADNPANLSISERLKSAIRSGRQSMRNSKDGSSIAQIAEGALTEVFNVLTRIRELSVQAASDTIGDAERSMINAEVFNLKREVEQITGSTQYNGMKLLNDLGLNIEIQVGVNDEAEKGRINYNASELAQALNSVLGSNFSTTDKESAQQNLSKVNPLMDQLSHGRAGLAAFNDRLKNALGTLQISNENIEDTRSRIYDTDFALSVADYVKHKINTQSSISVMAQANTAPNLALTLLV